LGDTFKPRLPVPLPGATNGGAGDSPPEFTIKRGLVMRTVLLILAAAFVFVCGSGCLVASTTHHAQAGKSVVVWNDELYVVDLKARKARRVTLVPCDERERIKTIIIEEEIEEPGA
jgi:hypothetical protein